MIKACQAIVDKIVGRSCSPAGCDHVHVVGEDVGNSVAELHLVVAQSALDHLVVGRVERHRPVVLRRRGQSDDVGLSGGQVYCNGASAWTGTPGG